MIFLQSQGNPSILDNVLRFDYWLMLKMNRDWQNGFMDNVALFMRESYIHVPLYIFLLVFLTMNFGKKGLWWVIAALAMAGLNDILSSQIIKEIFDRPRPCREPEMAHKIRFLAKYCGMNGSFISSHASSHFAVATFIFQTLKPVTRWTAILYIWAGLIAYSQVYVGVHYPSDIFAGALFGVGIGTFSSRIFNKQIGLDNLHS